MEMSIVSMLWEVLFAVPVAYVIYGAIKGER